jgi:KDO2-lipid IV(A) lauroyltransferase
MPPALASRLLWHLAGLLGRLLGWLVGRLLRVRRPEVLQRLRSAGFRDPEPIASAMYASLGVGLFELLGSSLPGFHGWVGHVRLTHGALAALDRARHRGAIVAGTHTGNWDLAALAVAQRAPLTIVSKRLRVGWLDRCWQALRRERGVRVVDARGALEAARAGLARGELLVMMIDQAPERRSGVMTLPFLGIEARQDLAPVLLAARLGKPLALAVARRLDDGTHEVDVPLWIEPPTRGDRGWVVETARAVNLGLESFVRTYPSQWLWLHRRWKRWP